MYEKASITRVLRRIAAIASGATLLQIGSCTVDEALLTDFANVAAETILTALMGSV